MSGDVRTAPRSELTDAAVRQAVQPPFKAKRCGYRIPLAAKVACPCSSMVERDLGKIEVPGSIPGLGSNGYRARRKRESLHSKVSRSSRKGSRLPHLPA